MEDNGFVSECLPHPSPSNWFLHSGFLPRTLTEILMVTFSFLPTKSRVSVDFFLFRVGICYCSPEQNLPLEVGFVANKIANKIIVMIAYINWRLTLCQDVENNLLVLPDLILSTIIFSPFCSWERLTYLPKLAVEFLPSIWNCQLVMLKFTIAYFLLAIEQMLVIQDRLWSLPSWCFYLVRWEYHRSENQQFKTLYNWVSFITALDVLTPKKPWRTESICVSPRVLDVVS